MSHELEIVNGVAQMAFAGETPWHGLGKEVPADLTPAQMLKAAGLDWTVEKIQAYVTIDGKRVAIDKQALVRSRDNKILDIVSDEWNPVQNQEAFDFFNDFVMAGDMQMNTAGALRGGQIVWGLARVNESFEVTKNDVIHSNLLFSNFHRFGFATDVRFTPIRVVCDNTLTMALNSKVERMVKITHRTAFDPENVKVMLGVAKDKFGKYKDMAQFLASKMYNEDSMSEYFTRVFPKSGTKSKAPSRNATLAMNVVEMQPGFEYSPGSFWSLFNTVTYMTDHLMGRSADTRLTSSWYGFNRNVKMSALETAVDMANAA